MDLATLEPVTLDRQKLVKWIRMFGDVNTDGLLEKNCLVFTIPEVEGFIGYKLESGNAIVFGDPVCSSENKPLLAKAFDEDCQKNKLGIVYVIASQEFTKMASKEFSGISVEFGTRIVLNPHDLPTHKTGSKAVGLRKKVKHALHEGILVKEYSGDNPEIENEIAQLAETWVKQRQGPQIYFSDVTLFKDAFGKRWFYAIKDDQIIGLLVLNAIDSQRGWLMNNIMMKKESPSGLSELLIISALEILGKEGCRFVLAGPVTSKKLRNIVGLGAVGSVIIQLIFKLAHFVFGLGGHETYWDKYQPQYRSCYLLFPHKNFCVSSLKALMKALHAGKS